MKKIYSTNLLEKRKIKIEVFLIDYLFIKALASAEGKTIEQYIENEINSKTAEWIDRFYRYSPAYKEDKNE